MELVSRQRLIPPSQLHWDIVKAAGREAAIEMPQSGNDHPHDRDLDVWPGLIEDEKIKAHTLCEIHAGAHLGARVEPAELRAQILAQGGAEVGLDGRAIARH